MNAKATSEESVKALAELIGDRNFITFDEIEKTLGLSQFEVIFMKRPLEVYLENQPGGLSHTIVTSEVDSDRPGLFIED